jgi:hypothetical protein
MEIIKYFESSNSLSPDRAKRDSGDRIMLIRNFSGVGGPEHPIIIMAGQRTVTRNFIRYGPLVLSVPQ